MRNPCSAYVSLCTSIPIYKTFSLKCNSWTKCELWKLLHSCAKSAHVNMWVCPMANLSCFSAALFQRLKINIRFVLYFPCCASSLYEVMPHTGNASIILLVAQSSFLQTGWHNILSITPQKKNGDLGFHPKNPPWFKWFVLKKTEQLSFLRNKVSEPPWMAVVSSSSDVLPNGKTRVFR